MNNKILSSILIGLCLLSVVIGIINTISGSNTSLTARDNNSNFNKIFYKANNKIALISLNGEISSEESSDVFQKTNNASDVRKTLEKALKDKSVKGVLLKINSPGGTVGMSQEIYSLIMQIRKTKPVVVSMTDVAASGGYYISAAADRIYANPGTLTGSIGVIMSSFDAHNLLKEKLGITANVIKSGKFKDIASPYRSITVDEKNLLQNVINSTYNQFVTAIINGRVKRKDNYKVKMSVLSENTLRKMADGRVFTGEQAQKLGFVDQIGGFYEAKKAIIKMTREKYKYSNNLPVVPYNIPSGLSNFLYETSQNVFSNKDLVNINMPLTAKYPHQTLFAWE